MHFSNDNLPFGGVGESGFGAYHGKYGFDTFSHMKPVLSRKMGMDGKARYPPYTKEKMETIRKITKFPFGTVFTSLKVLGAAVAIGFLSTNDWFRAHLKDVLQMAVNYL